MPKRKKSKAKKKPAAQKPRIRRDPAEARRHILDAACRVLVRHGPDAVGLKDVATEAGVSHGLITHYFGRFDALIEAVLETTAATIQQRIIERLLDLDDHDVDGVLGVFFDVMSSREHGRLVAWALLSGRAKRKDFFARRLQAPKQVADAIEARLRSLHPTADVQRDEIDRLLATVLVVGFSMSFGRSVVWEGLGREDNDAERASYRAWLAELVNSRLQHALGFAAAAPTATEPRVADAAG